MLDRPVRKGANRSSLRISFFVRSKKSATFSSTKSLSGSSWASRASARAAAVFPAPFGPKTTRFSGSSRASRVGPQRRLHPCPSVGSRGYERGSWRWPGPELYRTGMTRWRLLRVFVSRPITAPLSRGLQDRTVSAMGAKRGRKRSDRRTRPSRAVGASRGCGRQCDFSQDHANVMGRSGALGTLTASEATDARTRSVHLCCDQNRSSPIESMSGETGWNSSRSGPRYSRTESHESRAYRSSRSTRTPTSSGPRMTRPTA